MATLCGRCTTKSNNSPAIHRQIYLAGRYLIPFLIATFSEASHGTPQLSLFCKLRYPSAMVLGLLQSPIIIINRGLDFSAPISTTGADDRYSSGTRRNRKARSSSPGRQRSSSFGSSIIGNGSASVYRINFACIPKLFRMML